VNAYSVQIRAVSNANNFLDKLVRYVKRNNPSGTIVRAWFREGVGEQSKETVIYQIKEGLVKEYWKGGKRIGGDWFKLCPKVG
jgi:hypothetical protein